jgi:PIN domain nuclease of toxin-antitoxin system
VKILLDTHVWIWSHLDPDRIGKRLAQHILDPTNELWLSPISLWEFLVLVGKKRLAIPENPADWIAAALAEAPMHEAPLNHEVALTSRTVKVVHEDPADRFLAATAAVYDLALATADERLLAGKGFRTLANR